MDYSVTQRFEIEHAGISSTLQRGEPAQSQAARPSGDRMDHELAELLRGRRRVRHQASVCRGIGNEYGDTGYTYPVLTPVDAASLVSVMGTE
jgi:hypothetical protein